jgi:TolA-binding protein
MWDYLVCFSTWTENNSGQIQIVIGGLALWLAVIGYKKVLEQMTNAAKLEKTANEQREFELRLQLIQIIDSNSAQINQLEQKLKRLQDRNRQLIGNLNDANEYCRKIKEPLQTAHLKLNELGVTLKSITDESKSFIRSIIEDKNLTIGKLEEFLIIVSSNASTTSKIDAQLNNSKESMDTISAKVNK